VKICASSDYPGTLNLVYPHIQVPAAGVHQKQIVLPEKDIERGWKRRELTKKKQGPMFI
jgi:hypothetical protein